MSLLNDVLITDFSRKSSGKLSLFKTSTIVELFSSSKSTFMDIFASLMMLHISRMDIGTFPHSFTTHLQSPSDASGNNSLTRCADEISSNTLIFSKKMGSLWLK